jgi:hypothetical protein
MALEIFRQKGPQTETTFGFLSTKTKSDAFWTVKAILRQCFPLEYLKIDFKDFPGKLQLKVKSWSVTDAGQDIILKPSDISISLPDPVRVTELILR